MIDHLAKFVFVLQKNNCLLATSVVDETIVCFINLSPPGLSETKYDKPHTMRYATEPIIQQPVPLFTKKTPSYQYRDSHYKPETVVSLS